MIRIKATRHVEPVLQKDPNAVHERDRHGNTPLHWAAWRGHSKMITLLVEYGADVNARNARYGNTPLHDAARMEWTEAVRTLLELGADPLITDDKGQTPQDMAQMRNHTEVWLLLEAAINTRPAYRTDIPESHPVLTAARTGNLSALKKLVSEHPAAVEELDFVNYKSKDLGQTLFTPLHWAAWNNDIEMVEFLIDAGANLNDRDFRGATPLHLAAWRSYPKIVKLLIDRDAYVRARDNEKMQPLHYAARGGYARYGDSVGEVVRMLIKTGADVNARSATGATPLAFAIEKANPWAAELIRSRGGVDSPIRPLEKADPLMQTGKNLVDEGRAR